ncbi:MAG: universal stress protein [Bacteroidetes bacterium]|nr:universal stress protein [Bacteroidota bacterium]MCH8525458.1 universal stress protein [Balneolales bacterium]
MKKLTILVPTDFSEISLKALRVAGKMATLVDGKVSVLYSFEKNRYERSDSSIETAKEDLDALVSSHLDASVKGECLVSEHKPVDAIIDVAKEYDLVVMSSHGRTGISKLMLGSVTEKVVRLSKPPVLVVKNEDSLFPLNKILVTTDFSQNAKNSYGLAAKLAELSDASIHLLYAVTYHSTEPATHLEAYVRTKEKKFRSYVERYFPSIADRVTYEAKLTKKSAHEFITRHISDNEYNLVVMATLGRTGLDYLKMGSTTGTVIRNVDTNVIITNPVTGPDWNEVAEENVEED